VKLRERLEAMAAGRAAGLGGEPVLTCPYTQDTPDERALASAWVRAYLDAKPAARAAVSYDG
jgi:ribosome modulation factor